MSGGRIEIEVVPQLRDFPGKLESGLKSASGLASTLGKGLGLAVAAGTAVAAVGLKNVLDIGIKYTSTLNTLQSVTQATGVEMTAVGNLAKQLGADMSLPATSAADAAAAMTELAKGGLSVNEAMTAAKGTLQLAAAAQIDAAQAAEIQSDALNQFGLAADQATHVADLLANTANAASGDITDMANALKFVGPVAKALGADIDSVSVAIGLLAVQGIRGEQAGTSLRGIIASLSAPSKEAAKALADLGVKAFDQTGKFVGLRTITEQLAAAKGRMTEAEFAAAAATAFGNEGLTAASALASSGGKAFDEMAVAVTRAGGAAEVAGAKTKGLGGAWEGLKSQLETTGIEIFEAIDGPLESLVRSAANFVDDFGGKVATGIETAVAAGQQFGPSLADAIRSRGAVIGAAVDDIFGEIARSSGGALSTALNAAIGLWNDFTTVLRNVVDAARPVATGIAAVVRSVAEADGPLSAVASGLGLLGDAAGAASSLLIPIGALVGGIASAFSSLPGPIQTAVIALGLVAAFKGPLSSLGDTVRDRVTTPFRNLGETIRLQQALLTGSTRIASQEVGKLGLAFSALEKHVPVIGRMADSYRGAAVAAQGFVAQQSTMLQAASGISGQFTGLATALGKSEGALRTFAGTAAGAAAAVGTGLKAAAGGLVAAMGGPFGLAIAGAAVGLSLLASSQQAAAQKAQEHQSRVGSLTDALLESNGIVTEAIRLSEAKSLQSQKLADTEQTVADAAREAGISLDLLTDAALGNGKALDELRAKLEEIIRVNTVVSEGDLMGGAGTATTLNEQGQAAKNLLDQINNLAGGFKDAERRRKELDAAIKSGTASMLEGTSSGRGLAAAIKAFGDNASDADTRARSLKAAIDALSGGNISLEASQSRVEETLSRMRDTFKLTGDEVQDAALKSKGWGDSLINAQGGINLTTENGRRLRDMLQDLTTNTAEVAAKTYDMAIAQGDSIPVAAGKAQQAMATSRQAFIEAAGAMGIGAEKAAELADRAGLIPENVAMVVSTPGSDQTKIELALVKSLVDQVPGDKPITVRTLSAEAEKKLEELGFKVTHMPDGTVQIQANTAGAQGALDNYIASNSGRTITVRVQYVAINQVPSLTGNFYSHDGNYLKAAAFAAGGIGRTLTPMRGGVATIVPPNTWRVVGDRMVDDEAYIPINRSPRSVAILADAAHQMGFQLTQMWASGGIAAQTARLNSTLTSITTSSGGIAPVINIDARGATPQSIRMLEQSTIPKLTRLLTQQVGKRV